MADGDIVRTADLTGDEIIAANLARLGVVRAPVSINVMRERVFKKAVELADRDGELASSILLGRELGIGQSQAHGHLQELEEQGRMLRIGSGAHTRYMPILPKG